MNGSWIDKTVYRINHGDFRVCRGHYIESQEGLVDGEEPGQAIFCEFKPKDYNGWEPITNFVLVDPDTPQNRLQIQLKYGKA